MEAGNLRHKITLQRPAGGDLSDPNGATEWEDYATTNASVLPLRSQGAVGSPGGPKHH